MNQFRLAAIVEGHGEVEAVPALCHRLLKYLNISGSLIVEPVLRQSATGLIQRGELERYIQLARIKLRGSGALLVLLDCDDSCPAKLGPDLLARVQAACPGFPCSVVLAHREFEAWFLGSAESLRGVCRLRKDLKSHPRPETPRDCKGWLSSHMPAGKPYDPVMDQVALVRAMDLGAAAKTCHSFDKLVRDFGSLLRAQGTPRDTSSPS